MPLPTDKLTESQKAEHEHLMDIINHTLLGGEFADIDALNDAMVIFEHGLANVISRVPSEDTAS